MSRAVAGYEIEPGMTIIHTPLEFGRTVKSLEPLGETENWLRVFFTDGSRNIVHKFTWYACCDEVAS